MEKNLLDTLISDLEKLTSDLKALAGEGTKDLDPEKPQTQPETEKPLEPEEKPIEFTEVRKTLSRLSAEGHTAKIRELINSFGVDRLSDVPKEKYSELMKKAEVLNEK